MVTTRNHRPTAHSHRPLKLKKNYKAGDSKKTSRGEKSRKSSKVRLNVGGILFTTSRATLECVPGAELWKLDREIFLDWTPDVFEILLSRLRVKRAGGELNVKTPNHLAEWHKAEWSAMLTSFGFTTDYQVGQRLDARDNDGNWYESMATRVGIDIVKVHFVGWESRWDDTIPKYTGRLASLYTHTTNWRSATKVGTFVDIKMVSSYFSFYFVFVNVFIKCLYFFLHRVHYGLKVV